MSNSLSASALVTTEWLSSHIKEAGVKILDATFFRPDMGRDGFAEFLSGHIPGALFFDMDTIRDRTSSLPIMLPSADVFSREVGKLGISNCDSVIVYDAEGCGSLAARAWWMFRVFGHENVFVLDGGLHKWKMEGRSIERSVREPETATFSANFRPNLVANLAYMQDTVRSGDGQIIDTRSAAHFNGAPSFLAKRAGHIPGAKNLPVTEIIEPGDQCLKSNEQVASLLKSLNVNLDQPLVLHCGGGGSAPVLALALFRLGLKHIPVYDGSWAEWGNRHDTPIEV